MSHSSDRIAVQPTPLVDASWRAVDAVRHLDPRVWLLWLLAAVGPALFARNPFPLLATLVAVLTVRVAWAPAVTGDGGWRLIVRLALLSAVLSVVFNALTAPFGDTVLIGLPGWWPFGDVVTLNAVLFGGLTALAITVIVLATTTAGLLTDWPELLRRVPGRFQPLAVAGSVAWGFVPGTIATLRDIRDAQRVRGIRVASARAVLPILLPLVATALDRATTLAEAMESRGFGGRADDAPMRTRRSWLRSAAVALAIALAVTGVYVTLDGGTVTGVGLLAAGVAGAGVATAGGRMAGRTRYRTRHWRPRDLAVAVAALIALVVDGATLVIDSDALRYSPYPDVGVPTVSLPVILAAALLMVPAVVAPLVKVSMAGAQPLPLAPSASRSWLRRLRTPLPGPAGEGESSRPAGQLPRSAAVETASRQLEDRLPAPPKRSQGHASNGTYPRESRFVSPGGQPGEAPCSPLHPVPAQTNVLTAFWDRDGEGPGEGLTARHRHGRDPLPCHEAQTGRQYLPRNGRVDRNKSVAGVTAPAGAGQGTPRPYVNRVADRQRRPWASWPGRVRPPFPMARRLDERTRLLAGVAGD